jgi:hypothetical protein
VVLLLRPPYPKQRKPLCNRISDGTWLFANLTLLSHVIPCSPLLRARLLPLLLFFSSLRKNFNSDGNKPKMDPATDNDGVLEIISRSRYGTVPR